jgi:hypothetical protein
MRQFLLILLLVGCATQYQVRSELAARVQNLPEAERERAAVPGWREGGGRVWLRWDALRVPPPTGAPTLVVSAPERRGALIAGYVFLAAGVGLAVASIPFFASRGEESSFVGGGVIGAGAGSLLLGGILALVGRNQPVRAEVDRDRDFTYYDGVAAR